MKKLLMFGAGALLATALVLPAFADQPAVPSEPIKMALTKKPVVFDHAVHKDRQCAECHHQVDGKDNFQKCSTAGCHDVLGQKDKTVHSYYRIAHDRKVESSSRASSAILKWLRPSPTRRRLSPPAWAPPATPRVSSAVCVVSF